MSKSTPPKPAPRPITNPTPRPDPRPIQNPNPKPLIREHPSNPTKGDPPGL